MKNTPSLTVDIAIQGGWTTTQEICYLKRIEEKAKTLLAERFYKVWKAYSDDKKEGTELAPKLYGFESFRQYLNAPEASGGVHYAQSTAYQYVRVYRKLFVELSLPPEARAAIENTDWNSLDYHKEHITEENWQEEVERIQNNSRSDNWEEHKERSEGKKPDRYAGCKHKTIEYVEICEDCGRKLRRTEKEMREIFRPKVK